MKFSRRNKRSLIKLTIKNSDIPELSKLNDIEFRIGIFSCRKCDQLNSIPFIERLCILHCTDCTSLSFIPEIKFKEIQCDNCPSLSSLPNISGLRVLSCNSCDSLRIIPNISSLEILHCNNCPLLNSIQI